MFPLIDYQNQLPYMYNGLIANIQRSFQFKPTPNWISWVPIDSDGEKHPVARVMSERLLKLNKALMKCVCRQAGKARIAGLFCKLHWQPISKILFVLFTLVGLGHHGRSKRWH